MNKYHKYIIMGGMLLASLGMYSCQDYLDRDEESIVNEEDAFKNFRNFQGFTEELYYCIPLFHGFILSVIRPLKKTPVGAAGGNSCGMESVKLTLV